MERLSLRVEPRMTGYLFNKASQFGIPLSGTFELSPVCNFSCRMCYVRKTCAEVKTSSRPIMTLEQWLEVAHQAKEQGTLFLLLTGGEPLLWPDFWTLYEQLIQMGFLVSINTNGSMIDDEAIRRFQKLPPVRINITLYGASDKTYEALCGTKKVFSKVDYAITELSKAHIPIKLNGSLTPQNISDLELCMEYAKSKGLVYETVTYMFPPLRRDATMVGKNERFTAKEAAKYSLQSYRLQYGEDNYHQRLLAIANGAIDPPGLDENCIDPVDGKIRCRAGKASYWITWDGFMTPCGMMPEPKIDMIGRTFLNSWKELINISDNLRLSSVCESCTNRQICHSCAAMAMAETGTTSGIPKYLCEMVQEMQILANTELLYCNSS